MLISCASAASRLLMARSRRDGLRGRRRTLLHVAASLAAFTCCSIESSSASCFPRSPGPVVRWLHAHLLRDSSSQARVRVPSRHPVDAGPPTRDGVSPFRLVCVSYPTCLLSILTLTPTPASSNRLGRAKGAVTAVASLRADAHCAPGRSLKVEGAPTAGFASVRSSLLLG